MNPIEFMKFIKNPQQAVTQMMKNNQNPVFTDLVQKAQNGDTQSVESFARNIFKEQGRDFDKEIQEFMSYFK